MPNTEEQRLDLIDNCDLLLAKFVGFTQTDDTPEGRLLAQLNWLKERAANHDLPLPVNQDYLATIRYIYTDGTLNFHASSPDKVREEMEIPMKRIIALAKYGNLLYKSDYKPYVIRTIDALRQALMHAHRPLSEYEQGFFKELKQIKNDFNNDIIVSPLGGCSQYPNLIESEDTIVDIKNAKQYFRHFFDTIFNGVRPDTWLTPELADQETQSFVK